MHSVLLILSQDLGLSEFKIGLDELHHHEERERGQEEEGTGDALVSIARIGERVDGEAGGDQDEQDDDQADGKYTRGVCLPPG